MRVYVSGWWEADVCTLSLMPFYRVSWYCWWICNWSVQQMATICLWCVLRMFWFSLVSDVCKSCKWKLTVVHSIGLLIKVIQQSPPSKSITCLDPIEFCAYPLDQNDYIDIWRKCFTHSLTKLMWGNQATEGNTEQVMQEDSILYEILGWGINGISNPDSMLYP